jgi:hypothetical protein
LSKYAAAPPQRFIFLNPAGLPKAKSASRIREIFRTNSNSYDKPEFTG